MPFINRNGVRIRYEVTGEGFPLLLLAPGGLDSTVEMWSRRPDGQSVPWFNPLEQLADQFRVIAMDQRNTGRSSVSIAPDVGWSSYVSDQLAVVDHLGVDQFHVMGGCIGASYALGLIEADPNRVASAVLQNPIGSSGDNSVYKEMFDGWARQLQERERAVDGAALASFGENMFGGDFVFSVGRPFVRQMKTPLLILAGDDQYHPEAIALELDELSPNSELVRSWAGRDAHSSTVGLVREFLLKWTPEINR